MNHQPHKKAARQDTASSLTEAQLAQIFAPPELGIYTRGEWDKLGAGCQRLIDHYATKGDYTSPALTLAIVCKALIAEMADLRERVGPGLCNDDT